MPTIWYYKNVRFDGGVRTGLDVNDERVFQLFVEGPEQEDPALEWFVDVQCSGQSLPTEPEATRQWFLEHVPAIQRGIEAVADRLAVGIDELSFPYVYTWTEDSITYRVRCSAIRRITGLEIATNLRRVAAGLESEVRALPRAELLAV